MTEETILEKLDPAVFTPNRTFLVHLRRHIRRVWSSHGSYFSETQLQVQMFSTCWRAPSSLVLAAKFFDLKL